MIQDQKLVYVERAALTGSLAGRAKLGMPSAKTAKRAADATVTPLTRPRTVRLGPPLTPLALDPANTLGADPRRDYTITPWANHGKNERVGSGRTSADTDKASEQQGSECQQRNTCAQRAPTRPLRARLTSTPLHTRVFRDGLWLDMGSVPPGTPTKLGLGPPMRVSKDQEGYPGEERLATLQKA